MSVKFVIKPMKYTTVNIHNYKDYTANSPIMVNGLAFLALQHFKSNLGFRIFFKDTLIFTFLFIRLLF